MPTHSYRISLTDRVDCTCAAANAHEMTLILKDQSSIKQFRFSVSKEFWRDYPFYNQLAERVFGECDTDFCNICVENGPLPAKEAYFFAPAAGKKGVFTPHW